MGSILALLMLLIWPLVCLVLFRTLRIERAIIWSILGAYLLLPPLTEIDLPLIPSLNKFTIPNLTVFVIVIFVLKERFPILPRSWSARLLLGGLILCVVPTVLTNGDALIFEVMPGFEPIRFITGIIPGQSWRDLGSVLSGQMLALLPFLLARHFLASETGMRELLIAIVAGALAYSIPSLIEIRFSPQINVWVYGFFQHDFIQMIREGGFRPIVFLPHALWLALYFATALLACAALMRAAPLTDRWKLALVVIYLFVMLNLCKSLASFLYGITLLPVVILAPPRWQIRLAVVMVLVAVTYPMLRNAHFIPLDWVLEKAGEISVARQESLAYRFNNEEQLLARAAEKPWFGWGAWGRNILRDPTSGDILTIPDGRWIVVFGSWGWAGYIFEFGLIALPVVLTWLSLRRDVPISPYIAPLCVILGMSMTDFLLNDTLVPLTWLLAGAILGHAELRLFGERPAPEPQRQRTVLNGAVARGGRRTVL